MITILDGGMGQELIARCAAEPTPLWATKVMHDEPALVRAVHDDFFAAGATVATTNSYAIHHDRLIPFGLDHQFEALHRTACEIACASRDAAGGGSSQVPSGPWGDLTVWTRCPKMPWSASPRSVAFKRHSLISF